MRSRRHAYRSGTCVHVVGVRYFATVQGQRFSAVSKTYRRFLRFTVVLGGNVGKRTFAFGHVYAPIHEVVFVHTDHRYVGKDAFGRGGIESPFVTQLSAIVKRRSLFEGERVSVYENAFVYHGKILIGNAFGGDTTFVYKSAFYGEEMSVQIESGRRRNRQSFVFGDGYIFT